MMISPSDWVLCSDKVFDVFLLSDVANELQVLIVGIRLLSILEIKCIGHHR